MTTGDIIERIDTALQPACVCGCGQPLSATGPSEFFAAEKCQRRWHRQHNRPAGSALPDIGIDPEQISAILGQARALLIGFAAALQPVARSLAQFAVQAQAARAAEQAEQDAPAPAARAVGRTCRACTTRPASAP